MKRREFGALLGGAAVAANWPSPVAAQQTAMKVVGYLDTEAPGPSAPYAAAFRQGLNESGYVEGQNLTIEYRWAEGRYDRLPGLADDLIGRQVDVIVTGGGPFAPRAAKHATSTIPIVFVTGNDPVAAGLVSSLARPGSNLTGISFLTVDLHPKRLELLSDLIPKAGEIALLVNPNSARGEQVVRDLQESARAKGRHLHVLKAGNEGEIDTAFVALAQRQSGALVVHADTFFTSRRGQLVALTARHAVPAIYGFREFVTAGGLISYGPSRTAAFRQAGDYAGLILKGAKTTDLPVLQPTTFELVVNLKTAKALGLTIPLSILARADEVIE